MQRYESVEEYLERGGKITHLGETSAAPNGLHFNIPAESETFQAVSWKQVEREADSDIDDDQYWKKLNERLDEELKKMKN